MSREERKTVFIFAAFSIITILLMFCAVNNMGILNQDVAFGSFISWVMYVFVCLSCNSIMK